MPNPKLRLIIEVEYDLHGETLKNMEDQLHWVVDHIAGHGLITDCSDAEVVTLNSRVEIVER